ncbi:hypothetical protein CVT26_001401 [Gymnopilus dilepis]|uniref:Uncharacterized protein n=1 Tax=Gymnopilus dilepis TaxID=231916 RepID=A0A409X3H5_9AGAR|nr:hypothetical protein CVT26_001401 [Gymnopilus dilepis]
MSLSPLVALPSKEHEDSSTWSSKKRTDSEFEAPAHIDAKKRKTEAETEADDFNIFNHLLHEQIDVFLVILSLLSSLDLFHLTRIEPGPSFVLRDTLTHESAQWVWRHARKNRDRRFGMVGPPPPPPATTKRTFAELRLLLFGFSEMEWAEFLFLGNVCEVCNRRKDDVRVICRAYTRVCTRCMRHRFNPIGVRWRKVYTGEMGKLRAYVPTTSVASQGPLQRTKLYHTATHQAWKKGYDQAVDKPKWVAERVEEMKARSGHVAACKHWHRSVDPARDWEERIPWVNESELGWRMALGVEDRSLPSNLADLDPVVDSEARIHRSPRPTAASQGALRALSYSLEGHSDSE